MDYENMKIAELKAIARERGLRDYSRLRKAELIAFLREEASVLQNHDQCLLPLQLRAPDPQNQLGHLPHLQRLLGLDQIGPEGPRSTEAKSPRVVKETRRKESTTTSACAHT